MGAYITIVDLDRRFGADNIVVWSNVNGDSATVPDAATVDAAIDEAEGEINDHFRDSRYVVPFAGNIPTQVKRWASIKAGAILYRNRGIRDSDLENRMDLLEIDTESEIREYLSYQRKFANVAINEGQPDAPVVV